MAGFISFTTNSGSEKVWESGNWVFRGFMFRLIGRYGDNSEMASLLNQCLHMQGLYVDQLEEDIPNIKDDLLITIKQVAKEIIDKRLEVCVDGKVVEEKLQKQYFDKIKDLVELF